MDINHMHPQPHTNKKKCVLLKILLFLSLAVQII